MLKILTSLVIFLCSTSTRAQTVTNHWNNLRPTEQPIIIFKSPSSTCRMKKDWCDLDVLVKRDLDKNKFDFITENKKIFEFLSIETCSPLNHVKCANLSSFIVSVANWSTPTYEISLSTYRVERLKLRSNLIGRAKLFVFYQKSPIVEHKVTVTAPRRVIDIVFDIWTWSFGGFIALRNQIQLIPFLYIIYYFNN